MPKVLLAWIGHTDLKASAGDASAGTGPIAQALTARAFDHAVLLCDHDKKQGEKYVTWLRERTSSEIAMRVTPLKAPTDYEEIYRHVRETLAWARERYGQSAEFAFHLSPGTPQMAVTWILVSTTDRAELVQTTKERGFETAKVPFRIAAEFLGDLVQSTGAGLDALVGGLRPNDPSFNHILHQSAPMRALIQKARVAAVVHAAPILIEGESGTGKELLAAAIHKASGRPGKFVGVNCGAIPKELVESEFFGHRKGAFTGALEDRRGHFEQASGGTLFLDEVGELTPDIQVKLLRAIQEKKIVRVGESKQIDVDARLVSATNRDLAMEVARGQFREDLYYRLAVLVLKMPPLRERKGDLMLLVDHFLKQQQDALATSSTRKKLSAGARNVLLNHAWPGNVRELEATILRALVWSPSAAISEDEMRAALATVHVSPRSAYEHDLGDGFDLRSLLKDISAHYIRRAVEMSPKNKSAAAKLIGFGSHQLLSQWMRRLRVDPPN